LPEKELGFSRFGAEKVLFFLRLLLLSASWCILLIASYRVGVYLAFSSPSAPNPVFFCAKVTQR
jgi:hypothetical protein